MQGVKGKYLTYSLSSDLLTLFGFKNVIEIFLDRQNLYHFNFLLNQ